MEHAVDSTKQEERSHSRRSAAPEALAAEPPFHPLLQLQRQAGNQAVLGLLQSGAIRAKLEVGSSDDPAEREADEIAARVMRTPGTGLSVSRKCEACEEEEAGRLRMKPAGSAGAPGGEAPDAVHEVLGSPGQPLDAESRSFFEPRFGQDFMPVRIHTDERAAASAREIGAQAYAVGSHIVFAAGRYDPGTSTGQLLLAHELAHMAQGGARIRRQPAPDANQPQRQTAQAAAPAALPGTPVYWGLDTQSQPRLYYISIPPPGRNLSEVATFIYGSPASAADLKATNPGIGDFLAAGTTLHLAPGTLSQAAQQSLNHSLETGLLLRTMGVSESTALPSNALMHHLTIGAQTYDLLDAQYPALLRGLAWHLSLQADLYKGLSENYLETRNNHVESSNSLVRGISDWVGDVSVPDESVYTGPRDRAQAIVADLAKGEPTEASIIDASRRLREVIEDYHAGERAWQVYITGTIEGAGATAAGLEVVRNTCFAIEAGLAGAVVAPVAFAAAGGGALGVTAAVGAGAAAGGTLRGTLEVALPGMQADKPAAERFTGGFKSGAIQGGIGAAGALVAPAVSGALAPRLGIVGEAAPTLTQRLALGASTGAVIGAPSGAASAALENAGQLIDGKMTTLQYLGSIGKGTVGGAVGGGVFGLLPIQGLYRSGGQPLNPFSGEPVIPRWMLAGPYSPLQAEWSPPAEFNALPASELPEFPVDGYGWARINGVWEPINLTGPNRSPLTLRPYGPDANGRTNYNVLLGDELVLSGTVTRPRGGTYPPGQRGQMPWTTADFRDPSGQSWIRGHNTDYADTIDSPGAANSNADPLNYTPEPSWWGLHLRRNLVGQIRATNGGYRQMNYYSPTPRTTVSGVPIPDGVYFVETNQAGTAIRAWDIPFNPTGPTQFSQLPQFEMQLNQVPAGLLSPTPAPAIGAAGGAAGGAAVSRRTPQQ